MKHPICPVIGLLAAMLGLTSCGEDRSGEYYALIGENLWIEEVMKEHYLWYDSIPELKESDYFSTAEEFLKKCLYSKALGGRGDRYSYIEAKTAAETRSYLERTSTYGFDFELRTDPTGTSSHTFARILYVLPGSPAAEAGLRRGDWLSAADGERLSTSNYTLLMNGGSASLARETLTADAEGAALWGASDTVRVGPSRPVELNPFFVDTVYAIGGRRVAYLMYNEFSTGPAGLATDTEYREQMRQLFARFKSEAPTDFILDLRYNPGGYLSCATDLASLLAPASALGRTFCTLRYNDITEPRETTILLNNALASENLDLQALYVITSSYTASASEAVINCLRPYLGAGRVVLLGEKTEGKNVAMDAYEDERYDLVFYPVVAYVLNAEGRADYVNGLAPDYSLSERNLLSPLLPLGDTEEYLLHNTLSLIMTGSLPREAEAQTLAGRVVGSSLDVRSRPGLRLR